MTKITIELTSTEMRCLKEKAARELRNPNDQARFILRSVLLGTQLTNVDRLSLTESREVHVLEPVHSP